MSSAGAGEARDRAFDVVKGLGILGVLGIHSTNHTSRSYVPLDDMGWWVVTAINRFLNWSVPLFLIVSALLWARSVERKRDWATFYRSRAITILYPYAFWTLVYWGYRCFVKQDALGYTRTMDLGPLGEWVGPALFTDPAARLTDLANGKGYFHLYFMAILIGFGLAFPLIVWGMRRVRSLGAALLVGVLCQGLVFLLQREVFRLSAPGSTFFWHLLGLLPAVWIGLNWGEMPRLWQRWRVPTLVLAGASCVAFLAQSFVILAGGSLDGQMVNWTTKVFGFTFASAILFTAAFGGFSFSGSASKALAWMGRNSLQLYLVHPLILTVLGGPSLRDFLSASPAGPFLAYLLLLIPSVLITLIFSRLGLDGLLFGKLNPRPRVPEPPAVPIEHGVASVR